ncbi:MAG TPA: YdcF family protein [Actinomycetota bacterium]|nr:YdcF family protein [Actinomycetota bacterium]
MRILFKLVVLVVMAPVLYLLWTAGTIWQTSLRDDRPASDAIVVLGAAQYDGEPSPVFKARLDHARRLYEAEVAPLIVVLGGKQEGDRFTEGQAGTAYLERTLPVDRVTGVKAGEDTLDSLQKFTGLAEERQIRKIVLVSDPLHLSRAQEMAEDLGFETAVSASKIPESDETKRDGLIRETLNLTFYRIFSVS